MRSDLSLVAILVTCFKVESYSVCKVPCITSCRHKATQKKIGNKQSCQRNHWGLFSLCNDETEAIPIDVDATTDTLESNDNKNMELLSFGGTYTYTSQQFLLPLPIEKVEENLLHFFHDESIQHLLLSGGKNSTITRLPSDEKLLTSDIITKWESQVKSLEVEMPDPSTDSVVVVTPPGIELVTVKVIPTTTIGTKVVTRTALDDKIILPEFQGILIEDEPRAVGPRFFVWLFNKITYGGDPDHETIIDRKQNNRRESALLRVYIDSVEINDDGAVSFSVVAESFLRLEFDFPKLLLRFFPMRKEKAEKLCSDAILKALETNMLPAMESFCEEFVKSYPQ